MALKNFFGFKKLNYMITRSIVFSSLESNIKKDLVLIDVNDKSGYAVLSLNKPPVNSLNKELFLALSDALILMETNNTRGVILSSTSPNTFCSGLDINQLYNPDPNELRELASAIYECWLKLYGSSFPTAAALNGHTIAGGCFLAISADYRVMCSNFKFGINEIKVGVEVPKIIIKTMERLMPRRELELALTCGKLYSTEEALKVGLIDEIANDKNESIQKSENFLNLFKNVPFHARSVTKQRMRKSELDFVRKNLEHNVRYFVKSVMNNEAQEAIKLYLHALKNKT
ncbi:hypothetical protein PVAND_005495 [Polypedilum vanderplanki]|uniref:Enoyl-CoA hydratase n=1 Tax=Polypedilum vanderplanki TaxID=319348 RepID=A0A9J6C1B8_POLVA|nr:hypothetical protein PVAND_005495 [Polypedilum vanderplanki]